jgi:beta-lactamase regulating signal transducer with metallopeptidase domain
MLNSIIDQCNSFANSWARWIGMSILDATIILTVVSLLWFTVRRKAPPQLGYLLFLLVPLKLFIPLEIAVPERFFSWAPIMALSSVEQPSTSIVPHIDPRAMDKTATLRGPSVYMADQSDDSAAPALIADPVSPSAIDRPAKLTFFAWLMLAWSLGVTALLVRLVRAQIQFQRFVIRNSKPVDQARFAVDFDGLLKRIRVGRRIRIVESDRISSPIVWGIVKPTLILPAGIVKSLANRQLEWVLLHELAHVQRHDLIVSCFQRAVGILYFTNPSIWIANHMINQLREYACDDMALAYSQISQVESGEAFLGVIRYAASIQRRPEPNLDGALSVFESTVRASCFHRMTRLLDTNRKVSIKLRIGSLCLLLLVAVLALPQIRAANPPTVEDKATVQSAEKATAQPIEKTAEKNTEKKKEENTDKESVFNFSVVIARHVMLLEGKQIVTWPQIEKLIAKRPNPSRTQPKFYFTHGASETGMYESAQKEIERIHRDYKLVGHSEGSLWPRADLRYDRIQTQLDLKPDESLRIEGTVVKNKGEPVSGAEIILVTPLDASITFKTYEIAIVQGRIRNPLEEVMTYSSDKGQFALYPPKDQNFFLIALHPDGGIGFSGKDQFDRDHKIQLLAWAGLVSEFSKESEKQEADLSTRIGPTNDIPEIIFKQYWNDLKKELPTLRFGFTHVPPIFDTTIYRSFVEKDGGAISLPGASMGLIPGETRQLDLGPLTEQQQKQLEWMRSLRQTPPILVKPKDAAR